MRAFDQDALGMRAEKVMPYGAVRRPRPDIDAVRDQPLSVAAPGLQPQRAPGEIDRTFVIVAGDVTDVVSVACSATARRCGRSISPPSFKVGRLAMWSFNANT